MLPDFRLEVWFARWEFRARYHLSASDAESLSITDLLAMASDEDRRTWDRLRLGYTETRGLPALRHAIAATYDTISDDDVLCFAGAEEGLFSAMHALLRPADHAVVVVPNYQSLETIPLSLCHVTGVPLREERGWALDLDEVRSALRPRTRLIAVNFPNNPTGRVIPVADFVELVRLADRHGCWLLSDEVYRGLERRDERRLPQAADQSERGLSLNVLSKAYGLPGLRIGWIACRDRALLDRLERVKHYLSICNSAPSEVLATIALRAGDRILARNRGIVERNLPLLRAFFERRPDLFDWYEPDGGCVAYPRYLGAEGVEAFCRAVVEGPGVLLLPASIYASRLVPTPADRFRIGYGRRDMAEGLQALQQHLVRSATARLIPR